MEQTLSPGHLEAIRRLVEAPGYQFFAGNVAVSHAYAHMIEFGSPVDVGGLRIAPGDLVFGDSHGVLTVPKEIAAEIPARRSFSLEKLREVIRDLR